MFKCAYKGQRVERVARGGVDESMAMETSSAPMGPAMQRSAVQLKGTSRLRVQHLPSRTDGKRDLRKIR